MSLRNRLLTAASYANRSSKVPAHPYRLIIEISNACNLECTFCPRTEGMDRPIRYMEVEVFEKLLKNHRGQLEAVSLNGYGEPLVHPKLFEFVEVAHAYGVSVSISTNCTLLNEARSRTLLKSGIDHVILAIDGIRAEQYEQVRVGAKFSKVVENARNFLKMKKEMGSKTFVVIQCIAMVETKADIRSIHEFWKDSGHDAIRIRQLTHTGNTCGDEQFVNSDGPCYWLWAEPMILADGTVVPCCQDVNGTLALGNITEKPLNEIWSGDQAKKLRQLHAAGKRNQIPFCRGCNMYQPSRVLALGASFFDTGSVHRLLPLVESTISKLRYT